MAINLKGFRNIVVDGIKYKYKCVLPEKTVEVIVQNTLGLFRIN